jgi:uncharacterized protein (TIGR04255 family)
MPVELIANLGLLQDAPLKQALVQIRTPPMFGVDRPESVEQLVSVLPGDWALVDQGQTQRVQVQLSPAGVAQSEGERERVWRFESTHGRYVGTITPTSVAIETQSYEHFDEFHGRLIELLEVVAQQPGFAPRFVTRLGVRYVNELDDSRLAVDESRDQLVNPELLGPAATMGSGLVASLQELRFQQPDGTLAIRHGLIGPHQYLLDTDHYAEERQPFEVNEIGERIRRWHDTIEGVFAWAFRPWLTERGATW